MGDALSADVSFAYLATEIVAVAESVVAGERHEWLWFTKRPRRMAEFRPGCRGAIFWPSNLWAGTSITSNANIGRIRDLRSRDRRNDSVFCRSNRGSAWSQDC